MVSAPIVAGLAIGVVVLSIVVRGARAGERLEWLVGATAAFDFAQVSNVHLFTIATAVWLIVDRRVLRAPSGLSLALILGTALLACTSLFGQLVVSDTLAVQLVGFAFTAVIIGSKATSSSVENMARGFLAVCVFSAMYAIGQKAGVLPVREFIATESAGRVMGIYREPDWLGLFCAAGIIAVLLLEMTGLRKVALILVLVTAIVFSLARAEIIGLGAAGALYVIGSALRGGTAPTAALRRNRGVAITVVLLGGVLLAASPATRDSIAERFEGATSNLDVGAQARLHQQAALRELASIAPWYGHGLSSAGRVTVDGRTEFGAATSSVASNWILGWYVDSKYLAIPMIALLGFIAVWYSTTFGGALLIVSLVVSLVSNVTMLPITWFAVGLCLAVPMRRPTRAAAEPQITPRVAAVGQVPSRRSLTYGP